jgi:hypothetical protein
VRRIRLLRGSRGGGGPRLRAPLHAFCIETGTQFQPPYAKALNVISEVSAGIVELCRASACIVESVAAGSAVQARLEALRQFRDRVLAGWAGEAASDLLEWLRPGPTTGMDRAGQEVPLNPRPLLPICFLVPVLAVAGCGGMSAEAPSVENFARSWQLTSCEYVHATDPSRKVDLVAEGWTIWLYVNDNGMFRYATTPPGGQESFIDGAWSASAEIVTLTPDGTGGDWQFTGAVGEESATLRGASAEYDFDGDQVPEPAIWNMAMRN